MLSVFGLEAFSAIEDREEAMKLKQGIVLMAVLLCGCATRTVAPQPYWVSIPTIDNSNDGHWDCPNGWQAITVQRPADGSLDAGRDTSCQRITVTTKPVIEPVPGHPGYHYGPEHWECDAANNCELVRNWLDKDGKSVLTPLGCALAHTPIGWIFGDRPNMCEKKP